MLALVVAALLEITAGSVDICLKPLNHFNKSCPTESVIHWYCTSNFLGAKYSVMRTIPFVTNLVIILDL